MHDFGSGDIRYRNYITNYREWTEKWQFDNWQKYPGIPVSLAVEDILFPYGDDLQDASNRYWHYSLYLSIGYVIVIFGIKYLMSFREKGFDLRRYLTVWNMFLAVFSIVGTARCLPEFLHILYHKGFTASFCESTYYLDARVNVWYFYFTVSKAFELIDTMFIVLRKGKLIHLHWIHHVLTLTYSWYVLPDVPATARWMVNMNFFIHSMMYSYYALRAMRFYIPRSVNIAITSLQIAQMFAGLLVNSLALHYKLSGLPCDLSRRTAIFGFSLYFLFFLLFMNFFIKSYILGNGKGMFDNKSSMTCLKTDINQNEPSPYQKHSPLKEANGYAKGLTMYIQNYMKNIKSE